MVMDALSSNGTEVAGVPACGGPSYAHGGMVVVVVVVCVCVSVRVCACVRVRVRVRVSCVGTKGLTMENATITQEMDSNLAPTWGTTHMVLLPYWELAIWKGRRAKGPWSVRTQTSRYILPTNAWQP